MVKVERLEFKGQGSGVKVQVGFVGQSSTTWEEGVVQRVVHEVLQRRHVEVGEGG